MDRKTARRYVAAAEAAGLSRDAGSEGLTDELVGLVVEKVRPARPNGHGQSWDHPACLSGGLGMRSLTAHVMSVDVEVSASGIQGGRCG